NESSSDDVGSASLNSRPWKRSRNELAATHRGSRDPRTWYVARTRFALRHGAGRRTRYVSDGARRGDATGVKPRSETTSTYVTRARSAPRDGTERWSRYVSPRARRGEARDGALNPSEVRDALAHLQPVRVDDE